MRSGWIAGTTALFVVCAGLVWIQDPPERSDLPEWIPDSIGQDIAPDDRRHVLILVVGSEDRVRDVRAAVSSNRIVAEGPGSFALEPGRIVATSLEAAEISLAGAGWIDRPLEFITVASQGRQERASASSSARSGSNATLAALLSKPTLTQGEAMMALNGSGGRPVGRPAKRLPVLRAFR